MNELDLIPKNIKKYRLLAGLKQYEGAEKAQISTTYWNHIENGRTPPLQILATICYVLNIKIVQLFEE